MMFGPNVSKVADSYAEARRQMREHEAASRRIEITAHIVSLIHMGWSVDDAIAAGEKLVKFAEGANGNAG